VTHAVVGVVLTAVAGLVAWWLGGGIAAQGAVVAGLVATVVETAAVSLLRPALEPPFLKLLKRWAYGLGLRVGGVALVGVAVLVWPERFPVLPTALAFIGVLIPLLLGEMRLVVTRLRKTR
jgi:hypothetical protein